MFANPNSLTDPDVAERAEFLHRTELSLLHFWTDRLFLILLLLQWFAGIGVALLLTPRTWTGPASEIHPHLWAAVVYGGILTLFPSYLILIRPGAALTRYVIAVAQMLWSALLIHLTGGRIESHFHIFGSLAFLTFYRDWRVLLIATTVVISDHLLRGIFWPQSVYGIATSDLPRTLEHGFWVIFEDVFLLLSIRQALNQSWSIATNRAILERHHSGEIAAQTLRLKQANQLLEITNDTLQRKMIERNEVTQALRASEERYRRIAEFSPFAILVVNEDKITYANSPCATLLGVGGPERLLGKSLMAFVHPKSHDLMLDRLRIVEQRNPVTESDEAVLNCLDGTTKEVEVSAIDFSENGGHFFHVFLNDVSEKKRLEAMNRQSQRMEVTGQLAGGIAHDFNNLLAVILGCCQFMEYDDSLTNDNRELIEEIFKAGNRAASLTRQLLAYSRQQVLQSTIVNLNEVVIDTGMMLERVIGEDIRLTNRLCAELSAVKVDAGQIQQVVMNLAINARDAMPQGGTLIIETANVELDDSYAEQYPDVQPGPYAMLAVSDTGCGMDKKTRARIFEPFFTTKGVGKGTGLGLATVYGIVKQSGGHITVDSELGQGSTFKVYLPKCAYKSEAVAEQSASEPARGTETVLVVEDEDGVRNLTCRILRSQGYTVLEARNGADGVRVFEEYSGEVQLVLTDVVMPEMSGRQMHEYLLEMQPNLA
ncbi:MAG: ATP-binding protein, partial [Planctomycetota bacterium]|nr:ATP-binding protein [Planctomycetota bacterium]